MAKYFELKELLHSNTAIKKDIENLPSWDGVKKLEYLVDNYLDPLREAWNSPITITSGYRCEELNKAVGGSNTSDHMSYEAVDMQPKNTSYSELLKFFSFIKEFFTSQNIKVDQCFIESSGDTHWVHLGIGEKMRNTYKELKV